MRVPILVMTAAIGVTASAGIATATVHAVTAKPVTACATKSGQLRLVSHGRCAAGTHKVMLGARGPRGLQGEAGPTGQAGSFSNTLTTPNQLAGHPAPEAVLSTTDIAPGTYQVLASALVTQTGTSGSNGATVKCTSTLLGVDLEWAISSSSTPSSSRTDSMATVVSTNGSNGASTGTDVISRGGHARWYDVDRDLGSDYLGRQDRDGEADVVTAEPIFFASPAQWRSWLDAHHDTETECLVGFVKVTTGEATMTWSQSVDEALCFGWIDGVRRRADERSYSIRFTPRKPTSNWSTVNLTKMAALSAAGLVAPAGHAARERRSEAKTAVYSDETRARQAVDRAAGDVCGAPLRMGVLAGASGLVPAYGDCLGDEREASRPVSAVRAAARRQRGGQAPWAPQSVVATRSTGYRRQWMA